MHIWGYSVHPAIQKPTSRGFPIARTRWYSACIRKDYYLAADIADLNAFDRTPTFDGGALFCAPEDVVAWMSFFDFCLEATFAIWLIICSIIYI